MIPPRRKSPLSDRLTPAGIALLYAAFAALWIITSGYLLAIATDDPLLQSRIELAKGLAFVAVTGGLLYLLLKSWRESFGMPQTNPQINEVAPPKAAIRLALIFFALALVVPLIDFAMYSLHAPQAELETYDNLKSIAQLKAEEIENWLNERRGDAQGLAVNTGFARQVEQFLLHRQHDAMLPRQILNELDSLQANFGYDSILLLDTSGRRLSSLGKDVDTPPAVQYLLHQSLNDKQVQFSDLYRDQAGRINLDWVVPIIVADRHGKRAVAAVVLRVLPEKFLYPLIQTWSTLSASGETQLVRREDESVLLLNPLRRSKIEALTIRGSLNDPALPAAIAIRENKPGTVTGLGYRHVQVLAAYRPVAGTGWHLIAKIDRDEALNPVWKLLYWISAIASVAVALIMAALVILLRQQQRTHRLALQARSAESLRENNELLRLFIEHAPAALAMFDRQMRYLAVSRRWETDYGLTGRQLLGRSHYEIFPEIPEHWKVLHARCMAGETLHSDEDHLTRADGSVQWISWVIKPWHTSNGEVGGIVIFTEDLSERKRIALALEHNQTRLNALVQTIPDLVWLKDPKGVYLSCNPAIERLLGAVEADIIGKSDYDFVDREQAEFFRKNDLKAIEENKPSINEEWLTFAADNYHGLFETIKIPLKDAHGNLIGVLGIARDITKRKAAEAKITRLTQLYAALSECNQAIVRCTSEQELFLQICQNAVRSGGMRMAWIGLVDPASKQIRPVALYGDRTDYLEGIRVSADPDDPSGRGPVGTAIHENHPYWCQDFAHDPALEPWREIGNKAGWKAMAALPLHRDGSPEGILALYSDALNAFDQETRRLLTEISVDISFALDNFAHKAERTRARQELLDSEQRFRGLVEQSLAGIYIIQDGKFVYVNPRAAEIFGYGSVGDLIGKDLMQFIAEADRGIVAENMRKLLYKEVPNVALEFRVVRKEGQTITTGANASYAVYHEQPAVIGLIQDISVKKRDEELILEHVAQLKSTFMSTVQLATSLLEMRDPYTAGHERRVSDIAVAIATELGLDEQRVEGIKVAGYLHDIGKISIPAEILVKPGRLNATEYALVQGHAQASYEVLKIVPFPWPIATIALQHHERMDGSGYPNGLKGDEILLESRIMAVADVVEAMASHRPYRAGLGIDKALAELERGRGSAYDPDVVDTCLRLFREHRFELPPL